MRRHRTVHRPVSRWSVALLPVVVLLCGIAGTAGAVGSARGAAVSAGLNASEAAMVPVNSAGYLLLAMGLLGSFLVSALVWSLLAMGRRADAIAARRTAELRESEARVRALNDASPLGVFATDENLSVMYTNPALQRMLESPAERLLGDGITDWLHADDREGLRANWAEAMAGDTTFSSEQRFVLSDGRVIHTRAHAAPFKRGEARAGYIGTVEDVTKRLAIQQKLADSERLFRNLFDSIGDAIIVVDKDLCTTMANPAVQNLFGHKPESVVGQSVFRLFASEADFSTALERVGQQRDGSPFLMETKLRRSTGEAFEAEMRMCFLHDGEGAVTGYVAVMRDVSERRRAENALRASEAFANAIFDNSPVAIHVYDAKGYSLRMNEAARNFLGLPSTNFGIGEYNVVTNGFANWSGLSAHFARAYTGEVVELHDAALSVESEDARDFEEGVFAYDLTLFPIRAATGEVRAVVSFARDVSERKEAEHARRVAEERLRLVISNMPMVMFAVDAEGTITFADGKFLEVPGQHAAGIVGSSIFDFHAGNEAIAANIRRGLAGETFTAVIETGGRWFESRYSPLLDDASRITGLTWVSMDISERMQAERALRESEERYRKTFEGLHDVFFQTDLQDRFTMISPSAKAIFGWDPEELLGSPSRDLYVNPADHRAMAAQLSKGRPVNDYEALMRRKDGGSLFCSFNATIVFDDLGRPVATQGTARDITERKRAEDALRESEERYRSTFESLHDLFYETDVAGFITLMSPSCTRHTGFTPDELVGRHVRTVFAKQEEYTTLVKQLVAADVVNDFEAWLLRKDGSSGAVSVNATVVRDLRGKMGGFQGTLRDITERKQAEEERDRIFQLSVDMLSVIGNRGQITRVNPAWEATLGYDEEELVGTNVFDLVHADDVRRVGREAIGVERGLPVKDLRARFRCKDGSWRWLSWNLAATNDGAVYCVARDVTELMRAQEKLEQALKEMDQLRIAAEHAANHDILTGVANRRAWFAHGLTHKPAAIAIFDIDYFKRVNDTYGHPAGDEVLRQVAQRLQSVLPASARLGRLGGEEFGVLFAGTFAAARAACSAALTAVNGGPIDVDESTRLQVTVSCGLSPWRTGAALRERSLANTYEDADAALYEAKQAGRNRLVVRGARRRLAA